MKSAVIKTGGKQYLVSEGDTLKVEKLSEKLESEVTFKEILLTTTDKATKIGTPHVKGATVEAHIVQHGKHPKVTGVKMKPKKRYRRYFGHRQSYTEIEIKKIKTT